MIALFQFSSFFLILSLKDCCQIRDETDLKFKWIKHPIHNALHHYCNGQMMLQPLHTCRYTPPTPCLVCTLHIKWKCNAWHHMFVWWCCQTFHVCRYPHPPPALSAPVCDSDVILGTPYHWHAISVFELVLYRVEDQRSIFMQGDYIILI